MELRSIEAIVSALNDAKVEYLIVNGLAVNAHGFVRLTGDTDIVLGLTPENASRGLNTLPPSDIRWPSPNSPKISLTRKNELWRKEKQMIVLKLRSDDHRRTSINIFVYEPFDFASEMRTAEYREISPRIFAPVISLETLLEMKRPAGRPQDLTDIEELLRAR